MTMDLLFGTPVKHFEHPENCPPWPDTPTACPVSACPRRLYNSLAEFTIHWNKVHRERIYFRECQMCQEKFYTLESARDHRMKEVHGKSLTILKLISMKNELFVDPGGVLPYHTGSAKKGNVTHPQTTEKPVVLPDRSSSLHGVRNTDGLHGAGDTGTTIEKETVEETYGYTEDDPAAQWARAAKVWSSMEEQTTGTGGTVWPENVNSAVTSPYQYNYVGSSNYIAEASYRTETSTYQTYCTTNAFPMSGTAGVAQMPGAVNMPGGVSMPGAVQLGAVQIPGAVQMPCTAGTTFMKNTPAIIQEQPQMGWTPPQQYTPNQFPMWPPPNNPVFVPPPVNPPRASLWPLPAAPLQQFPQQYPVRVKPSNNPLRTPAVRPCKPNLTQVPLKQYQNFNPQLRTIRTKTPPQKPTMQQNEKKHVPTKSIPLEYPEKCPVWPNNKTECPVVACPKINKTYDSFEEFQDHWVQIHCPEQYRYQCQICLATCYFLKGIEIHMKQHVMKAGSKDILDKYNTITIKNKMYIDPKGVLPYRRNPNVASDTTQVRESISKHDEKWEKLYKTAVKTYTKMKSNIDVMKQGKVNQSGVQKIKVDKLAAGESTYTHAKKEVIKNASTKTVSKENLSSRKSTSGKSIEKPVSTYKVKESPFTTTVTISIPNDNKTEISNKGNAVKEDIVNKEIMKSHTIVSNKGISDKTTRTCSHNSKQVIETGASGSNLSCISTRYKISKDTTSESKGQKESKISESSLSNKTREPEIQISKKASDPEADAKHTDKTPQHDSFSETNSQVVNKDENFKSEQKESSSDIQVKKGENSVENLKGGTIENSSLNSVKLEKGVKNFNVATKVRNTGTCNSSEEKTFEKPNIVAKTVSTRSSKINIKVENEDEYSNEKDSDFFDAQRKIEDDKVKTTCPHLKSTTDNDIACHQDTAIELGQSKNLSNKSDDIIHPSCQAIWPGIPTPCPVAGCTKKGKFMKLNTFNFHWNKIHTEFSLFFECGYCNTKFESEKKVDAHKKLKSHKDKEFSIKQIKIANKNYIDPKGVLPYLSSSHAKNMSFEDRLENKATKESVDIKTMSDDQVSIVDSKADQNKVIQSKVDPKTLVLSPTQYNIYNIDGLFTTKEVESDSVQEKELDITKDMEEAQSGSADTTKQSSDIKRKPTVKGTRVEAFAQEKSMNEKSTLDKQALGLSNSTASNIFDISEVEVVAEKKLTDVAVLNRPTAKTLNSENTVLVDIKESSFQELSKMGTTKGQNVSKKMLNENKPGKKDEIKAQPVGPAWPNKHVPCPVPACAKLGNIPSFGVFQTHWWLFHSRKSKKGYIDPKDHLPYRSSQELKSGDKNCDSKPKDEKSHLQNKNLDSKRIDEERLLETNKTCDSKAIDEEGCPETNKIEVSDPVEQMTEKRKCYLDNQALEPSNTANSFAKKDVFTEVIEHSDTHKTEKGDDKEYCADDKNSNEMSAEKIYHKKTYPIWPEGLTVCPVLGCNIMCNTFWSFSDHWRNTHCPRTMFLCQLCKTLYLDSEEAKLHKFNKHNTLSRNIINRMTLEPEKDPKGVLPYQQGSSPEKKNKKKAKRMMKTKGKADRCKNKSSEDVNSTNVCNIPDVKPKICEKARDKEDAKFPVWPNKPATCPVPGCADLGFFQTFENFDEHFKSKHSSQIIYQCKPCNITFHTKKDAGNHCKLTHKIKAKKVIFGKNRFLVLHLNTKYINPKGTYPYHKVLAMDSLKIESTSVSETVKAQKCLKRARTDTFSLDAPVAKKNKEIMDNKKNQEPKGEMTTDEKDKAKTEPSVPIWPNEQAYCTVPVCAKLGIFPTYSVFKTHWLLFHTRKSKKGYINPKGCLPYTCDDPKQTDVKDEALQSAGIESTLTSQKKPNKAYKSDESEDTAIENMNSHTHKSSGSQLNEDAESIVSKDMPKWFRIPTPCPDQECKFTKLNKFQAHWRRFHVYAKQIISCRVCKRRIPYYNLKKHTHGGRYRIENFCMKKVKNKGYITPLNSEHHQNDKLHMEETSSKVIRIPCNEGMKESTSASVAKEIVENTINQEIKIMPSAKISLQPRISKSPQEADSIVAIEDENITVGEQPKLLDAEVQQNSIEDAVKLKISNVESNIDLNTKDSVKVAAGLFSIGQKTKDSVKLAAGQFNIGQNTKDSVKLAADQSIIDQNTKDSVKLAAGQFNIGQAAGQFIIGQNTKNSVKLSAGQSNIDQTIKDSVKLVAGQFNIGQNTDGSVKLSTVKEVETASLQKEDDSIRSKPTNIATEEKVKEEENDSGESDWPVWPGVPTPCPVAACAGIGTFGSFDKFMIHWKKFHWDKRQYSACKVCKGRINSTNRADHTHNMKYKIRDVLVKETEPNKLFIDPGVSRCFRKRKRSNYKPKTDKTDKSRIDEGESMPKKLKANGSLRSDHTQEKEQTVENAPLDDKSDVVVASESNNANLSSKSKEGPLWPGVPAPCRVTTCFQKGSVFNDFQYFIYHWKTYHMEKLLTCTCKTCGLELRDALLDDSMRVLRYEDWIKHISFNPHYVDPLDVKPYHEKSGEKIRHKAQLHSHEFDKPTTESVPTIPHIQKYEEVHHSKTCVTSYPFMKQNVTHPDLKSDSGVISDMEEEISADPSKDEPNENEIESIKGVKETETSFHKKNNDLALSKPKAKSSNTEMKRGPAKNMKKSNKQLKGSDDGTNEKINDNVLKSSISSDEELKGRSTDQKEKEDESEPTWIPWPNTPSMCPVDMCKDEEVFEKYRDFKEHWYTFHHRKIMCYKCESYKCKLLFLSHANIMRHKSIRHPHPKEIEKISSFQVLNPNYICPNEALPYLYGSPKERKKFLDDYEKSRMDKILTSTYQATDNKSDKVEEKQSKSNAIKEKAKVTKPSPAPVSIKTVQLRNELRDSRICTFHEPFSGPCEIIDSPSEEEEGPFKIKTVIGISNIKQERPVIMTSSSTISSSLETTESSLDKKSRPLWPLDPAECPVSECQKHGSFVSFVKFRTHWKKVHTKKKCFYQCVPCGIIFSDAEHTTAHRNTKTHDGEAFMTNQIIVPNPDYLDPKCVLPYQYGTAEEREKMIKEKQKMDKAQDLLSSIRAKLEAIKSKSSNKS